MRKLLYGVICVVALSSLQGCFWHTTEVEHDSTTPSGTVVVPAGSTVTTTTQP